MPNVSSCMDCENENMRITQTPCGPLTTHTPALVSNTTSKQNLREPDTAAKEDVGKNILSNNFPTGRQPFSSTGTLLFLH